MNAAFVLVTSAWLAGADPEPVAPPKGAPPAAMAAPAPAPAAAFAGGCGCSSGGSYGGYYGGIGCGGGCGSYSACGSCCDSPSFFSRLKGRFSHGDSCGCGTASVTAASSCDCDGGKHGLLSRFGGHHGSSSCGCEGTCGAVSSCGCESSGFFSKLRGCFHRGSSDCGCETSCSTGCSSGCAGGCGSTWGGYGATAPAIGTPVAPGTPAPAGEPIKPPKDGGEPGKKLPEGIKPEPKPEAKPDKEVRAPATLEVAPASSSKVIEAPTHRPFELDRRFEARVDRAADYSWITGQLFFVRADGGLWIVRYSTTAKDGTDGGSVVLAHGLSLDGCHEGDLVKVRGTALLDRGPVFLGAPLYKA